MIDEKKLIEYIETDLASKYTGYLSYDVVCGLITRQNEIIDIINNFPKIEKCGDCSRRKFYQ